MSCRAGARVSQLLGPALSSGERFRVSAEPVLGCPSLRCTPGPTSAAWSFPRQLVKFGWLSAASWLTLSRKWNFSCVNNKLLTQILVTKVQSVLWEEILQKRSLGEHKQNVLGFCGCQLCASLSLGFTNPVLLFFQKMCHKNSVLELEKMVAIKTDGSDQCPC